jgi:glycyl-tRNA synthetase beta chain
MLNDLLFELGTEELPSGAVWPLADALANNLVAALAKAKLQYGTVQRFATPRRLAVLIQDVETLQPSQNISRRGPAVAAAVDDKGQPTPALLGFAKSCGVTVNELTKSKTDKGEWWVYEAEMPGAKTPDLLPAMINEALAALPIAKPMRWGSGDELFARPVHWAVLLFGKEIVVCKVLGVTTGRQSFGHRFHHPEAVEISSPKAYETLLKEAHVIADFSKRREMIVEQVKHLAQTHNYQAVMPEALVDEVTSIVEWPQALLADFEKEFLDVPAEALIAAMQSHQKCFALRDKKEQLLPHFITVANIASTSTQQVIARNEKVMRARLSDAAFFYRQDKRQSLAQYGEATANVVFQIRLGSLQDKMNRIKVLMEYLTQPLDLKPAEALRAAELSKCDLMTGMVGEFPELQGLMGYYYARNDGEAEDVAQALNEQYMPRFAADDLPTSTLGLALSLTDRLDTIVGTFAIGQKPSGVKDPFKLRRHALAIVRLLIATPAALNISTLINQALHIYGERLQPADKAMAELKPFILERLQSFYQTQGIAPEVVQAVRARQDEWFFDIDKRIKALLTFVSLPEATSLSAACKRVNNLLQHAASSMENKTVDVALLEEDAEKSLFDRIQVIENTVTPLYSAGDYGNILSQLASLREPVDAFFEHVMVMVDNQAIKANRLALLARLQYLLQGVADISLLSVANEKSTA